MPLLPSFYNDACPRQHTTITYAGALHQLMWIPSRSLSLPPLLPLPLTTPKCALKLAGWD